MKLHNFVNFTNNIRRRLLTLKALTTLTVTLYIITRVHGTMRNIKEVARAFFELISWYHCHHYGSSNVGLSILWNHSVIIANMITLTVPRHSLSSMCQIHFFTFSYSGDSSCPIFPVVNNSHRVLQRPKFRQWICFVSPPYNVQMHPIAVFPESLRSLVVFHL